METNAQFPVKMASLFDKARYKVYYGGRGAGKSHSAAKALFASAETGFSATATGGNGFDAVAVYRYRLP